MTDDNQRFGMAYLQEIQEKGKGANPFFSLFGIEPISWGDGCARLEMDVRPDMTNGEGWLQGGMYTALADEAMALAIYTLLEKDQTIATISCTTSFLRGVKEGLIAAEGRVIRHGRQIIFAEGIVSSGGGETELARCSASFAIRRT